jgi:hypothetical protein
VLRPLLFCAALALAFPTFAAVGPEIPLSTPTIQPSGTNRLRPRIASNGDGFLVVWYDQIGAGIRAARLDRNGGRIDERSFFVAPASTPYVSVASDGLEYVVAYDCKGLKSPQTCLSRIFADSGKVEAGAVIEGSRPAIGSNGRGYLVVSARPAGLQPVSLDAVQVSRDARTVGHPVSLARAAAATDRASRTDNLIYAGEFGSAEIASDGQQYFVVWSSYAALFGVLVSPEGEALRTEQLTHTLATWGATAFGWSVASNGHGYVVVWQQNAGVRNSDYLSELRACAISPSGAAGAERTLIAGAERTWYPRVAWNGSAYDVTYTRSAASLWPYLWYDSHGADIRRVTVDTTGQLLSGPESVIERAGKQSLSAIASNGSTTVVTWERESRGGAGEIEVKQLGDEMPFLVSNNLAWQQSLAGTMSGDTPLVAWEELTGPLQRHEVVLQRLTAAALPRDGRGIAVEPSGNDQLFPALTSRFLAWIEQPVESAGEAFAVARRLDADGHPIGPLLRLGPAARGSRIALATARSQSLVAWEARGGIAGVLVSNGGVVLDPMPFAISPGTKDEWNPSVATDGSDFLVTWQRREWICAFECIPPNSLHAARVSAEEAVGPVADLAPADASSAQVVSNGQSYAVFWSGVPWFGDDDSFVTRIAVRMLDRNGVPLSGAPRRIVDASLRGLQWTGDHYLMAFNQLKRGGNATGLAPGGAGYVASLDRELKTTGLTEAGAPFGSTVALLPLDGATTIVAYPSFAVDWTSRAVARIIDDRPALHRRPASAP